jgi:hypothetical protein
MMKKQIMVVVCAVVMGMGSLPVCSMEKKETYPSYDTLLYWTQFVRNKKLAKDWTTDDVNATNMLAWGRYQWKTIINNGEFVADILVPLFGKYNKNVSNKNYVSSVKIFINIVQ